jgi:asparagine synthetase B (glutamine-hydrolysing)
MGALLVVNSVEPTEKRIVRLQTMAHASPHRGRLQLGKELIPGLTVGVQARYGEARLYESDNLLVAVHGRIVSDEDNPQQTGEENAAKVLARLWLRHGPACLKRIDGEYALCIVDLREAKAFFCVSLLMTRPLYVATRKDVLVLASEMRQCNAGGDIERKLDLEQAALSLWLGCPALERDRTEYHHIDRILSPIVYECCPQTRRLSKTWSYWSPPRQLSKNELTALPSAPDRVLARLTRYLTGVDGRIGRSLSAGHDSGLLFAIGTHMPEGCGTPLNYSLCWSNDPTDERPLIERMLRERGGTTKFIEASACRASDFVDDQVQTLDRIPQGDALSNAALLARHMAADGVQRHLNGALAEATLMVNPAYFADLLRQGRLYTLARHLISFKPFLLQTNSHTQRLRHLLRHALLPHGSQLARLRQRRPPLGVGERWRHLCEAGVRALEPSHERHGYSYGERLWQVDYVSLVAGLETWDQIFERQGIENVAPFAYKSLIDIGIETPPETLTRGRYDKQTLRDAATQVLGHDPGWSMRKLLPTVVNTQDPGLLDGLGPERKWRLIELELATPAPLGEACARIRRALPVANVWRRVAYFERYIRLYA